MKHACFTASSFMNLFFRFVLFHYMSIPSSCFKVVCIRSLDNSLNPKISRQTIWNTDLVKNKESFMKRFFIINPKIWGLCYQFNPLRPISSVVVVSAWFFVWRLCNNTQVAECWFLKEFSRYFLGYLWPHWR